MKNIIFILTLIVSVAAAAASGAHGEEKIPLSQIGWQAANLGILLIGIFFFIKKSIVEAFENRQKEYLARAEKTKSALRDAEAALSGIKTKLSELEAGEKKSLESAKQESEILRQNILSDAKATAEKIKNDAALTIKNELSKAKAEINNEILNQAVSAARKTLTTNNQTSAPALEASFVRQLEQVKP